MDLLDKVIEALGLPIVATVGAVAADLVFRLFKTKKPKSILLAIGVGARKLGELCAKLDELVTKIVPQRTE